MIDEYFIELYQNFFETSSFHHDFIQFFSPAPSTLGLLALSDLIMSATTCNLLQCFSCLGNIFDPIGVQFQVSLL